MVMNEIDKCRTVPESAQMAVGPIYMHSIALHDTKYCPYKEENSEEVIKVRPERELLHFGNVNLVHIFKWSTVYINLFSFIQSELNFDVILVKCELVQH